MQIWLQILFRSIGLFILTVAAARVMGKRNITRIPPYKILCYFVIALIAALISVNVIREVALGLVALGVWILLSISLDYLSLKARCYMTL